MGTLFVLVSPCFMKNIVDTCKIGSFLCSLDNLLQKKVIVFFFGNQISKCRSFEKRAILTYFFHIFWSPGKSYKNFLSTHLTHIHTCILLIRLIFFFFCLTNFEKKKKESGMFLFGMSHGIGSYSRHFGTINK